MWVSPFGYLRINAYLPLPVAFRSLSRPSSALSAKASALRSYSLNQAFRTGSLPPAYRFFNGILLPGNTLD